MKTWLRIILAVAFVAAFLASGEALQASITGGVDINWYKVNMLDAAVQEGVANAGLTPAVALATASAAGVVNLDEVNQMDFTDKSFTAFTDVDHSGGISTGDLFHDFITATITTFEDRSFNDITPLYYGGSTGRTFQITIVGQLEGHQITNNDWVIDSMPFFDVYFDSTTDGAFTAGNAVNGVGTLIDGILAEHFGTLIRGDGDNQSAQSPNGNLTLITTIVDDLLDPPDFETGFRDDNGNLLFSIAPPNLVLGITDSNNFLETTEADALATNLGTYFGFNPGTQDDSTGRFGPGTYDFGFTTHSTGSFNKELIPEPSTFLIWGGLGLIGLVLAWRRRK
jgi:hypothetical protein